jgi:valyl-tRNA synthetase
LEILKNAHDQQCKRFHAKIINFADVFQINRKLLIRNYYMMEIPSRYEPSSTEEKWYKYWMDQGFFKSVPDEREPYCIVIPPPNVTGVLHMGHMLNNTIQDVLVRRARMQGKNALWVPGTDHASIATEARVVAKLREQGIEKSQITREQFLHHAWDWKEKHGGIILEQLKKLGASCDWDRTKFTMDDDMSASVIKVFVGLFNKGYIYRGVRMVNWDPQAKTAVSDEEVIYREVKSKLYYVQYKVEGEDSHLVIATTRPETILGDTAVCVNPADPRFRAFVGKKVLVPLVNRVVPVIEDDYVDMEFGTGALKVTPAHDINDYNLGLKYNLPSIDIFNDDGTMSEQAGFFIGEDRFKVREMMEKALGKEGLLLKTEDYVNKVGYSERTDAVIEPKLSLQWFLNMKKLAGPALENVMNDEIRLHPAKFKNTYRHWMENVKDWCISRQLWWGQRIPAFYYGPNPNDFVVSDNPEEALNMARKITGKALVASDLKQDEDVLDTWFSSWLWPISVFDGIRNPDNPDIRYYYPTNDLVSAPDILFFWIARMIMAGYEYRGAKPFSNVYLTGVVRDNKRRKMSKSLGNSPDPIELMKKYSADGVRVGMLLCSPAGNDLLFDESLTEQGRNFGNKIWNAFRLINSWQTDESLPQPESSVIAFRWFESRLNEVIGGMDEYFLKYRLSDALMSVYKLFWDDFSSWYLEAVKPAYGMPIDKESLRNSYDLLEKLLLLMHPFIPFITEEIWQTMRNREKGESIMICRMPHAMEWDPDLNSAFENLKTLIATIRNVRNEKGIPARQSLSLVQASTGVYSNYGFDSLLKKLGNISEISVSDQKPANSVSFIIKNVEYYIPLEGSINTGEELEKLKRELEYTRGFLASVMKKLDNQRFVQNAPADVLQKELDKRADAESKIAALEKQVEGLAN